MARSKYQEAKRAMKRRARKQGRELTPYERAALAEINPHIQRKKAKETEANVKQKINDLRARAGLGRWKMLIDATE